MRTLFICCVFCILASFLYLPVNVQADWTFEEINYSPAGAYEDDYIYQISWRPQGDYALIAAGDGLLRYNYENETLQYLNLEPRHARAIQFSNDGSYALISNLTELYRIEHAESGFGTVSTITDIQSSGTITFNEVVFNPDPSDTLAYITTNRESTSGQHQLVIFRYDPGVTPQVYPDYSGGTTYAMDYDFDGISAAFQADGDYIVISNKNANGYHEGIFVYDPDQSTFPKESAGNMQWYPRSTRLGNTCAVTMGKAPGQRVVLVKGNGDVQRTVETGVPASFNNWDEPGPSPNMTNYMGDADYGYDGRIAIVVEREMWSPYHRIGTFDENGDAVAGVDLVGLPEQRTLRLNAVAWHPSTYMGLIGGQDRWMIRFTNSTEPTPTPSPTMTPSPTSTAPPITPGPTNTPHPPMLPVTDFGSLSFLLLLGSLTLLLLRKN